MPAAQPAAPAAAAENECFNRKTGQTQQTACRINLISQRTRWDAANKPQAQSPSDITTKEQRDRRKPRYPAAKQRQQRKKSNKICQTARRRKHTRLKASAAHNPTGISTVPTGRPLQVTAAAAQLAEATASSGATAEISQNTTKQDLQPAKLTNNAHKASPQVAHR